METQEPNGCIPAFPAPIVRLDPDERLCFVDLVLNGNADTKGCGNDLIDTHQKEYSRLLSTDLIEWFRESGIDWNEIAEVLGKNADHMRRRLDDGTLTGEQIFRLMRAYPACRATVNRFLNNSIPPVEALIGVEHRFRTHWLTPSDSTAPHTVNRASLLDAVLMCAFCRGEHMNLIREWCIHFSADLRDALGYPAFRELMRSILDDALAIASDHAQLGAVLSAWPCPLTDGEPFLRVFAPAWNLRHNTWFIAYEANFDQF